MVVAKQNLFWIKVDARENRELSDETSSAKSLPQRVRVMNPPIGGPTEVDDITIASPFYRASFSVVVVASEAEEARRESPESIVTSSESTVSARFVIDSSA